MQNSVLGRCFMSRNIEMNYKTDSGYEVLYPQVQMNNIISWNNYVYSKSQIDSTVSGLNNSINSKANQSDLNALSQIVSQKANQSDLNNVSAVAGSKLIKQVEINVENTNYVDFSDINWNSYSIINCFFCGLGGSERDGWRIFLSDSSGDNSIRIEYRSSGFFTNFIIRFYPFFNGSNSFLAEIIPVNINNYYQNTAIFDEDRNFTYYTLFEEVEK